MASRAIWKGELKLAMVSCPVALHSALEGGRGDIHFHLLNPRTGNRINTVPVDPEAGEVDRADLVRGYEVSKGRYVLFDKEDFAAARIEATKVLEIERFVDADSIDRIYWDVPYYLVPAGKDAARSFGVILAAIEKSGQVGIGRFVMRQREHFCAVEPRGDLLLVTTLRTEDEIRPVDEATGGVPRLPRLSADMLDIAQKIIEQKSGRFEPEEFRDSYEEALADLIKRKQHGEELQPAEAPAKGNVVDLMDALKASLGKGGAEGERAQRYATARTRAPKPRSRRKRRA
jgi:DNA end-binding protein Ku